jgi:hypothetical protein
MKSRLDRRTFLKDAGALTASAALIASGAPGIAVAEAPNGEQISAVLFDSRYSSCRAFAGALIRKGAMAFDARADVAALWYGPLRDRLAKYGGGVAGLVTDSDSMVSEAFGKELRLSLRYEGSHDSRASAVIIHKLRSLQRAAEIESALRSAGSNWGRELGCVLARTHPPEAAKHWESAVVRASQAGDHPGFLRSWLLAT